MPQRHISSAERIIAQAIVRLELLITRNGAIYELAERIAADLKIVEYVDETAPTPSVYTAKRAKEIIVVSFLAFPHFDHYSATEIGGFAKRIVKDLQEDGLLAQDK